MSKQYLILFLIIVFNICKSQAQELSGRLTDKNNESLPFANIFVQNTNIGTTSNEEGYYKLKLPKTGTYTIIFQYIGYKQQNIQVTFSKKNEEIKRDIQLESESLNLTEVVVSSEDPAYEIIRNAQAKRKYYLEEEIKAYRCNTYTKILERSSGTSNMQVNLFGIRNQALEGDSGIFYLSETVAEVNYQRPKKLKERVISSLVSGNAKGYSLNRSVALNPYRNMAMSVNDLSIVSPIADGAMAYYKYEFLGDFKEGDLLINKIKVEPKNTQSPAFSGIIYIIEDLWRVHSFDLYLQKPTISTFTKLGAKQTYIPIGEVWMPSVFQFYFDVGSTASGYYMMLASDYEVNLNFPKDFFNREILNVEANANEFNAKYWQENRPLPLTKEEEKDYTEKFLNYEKLASDTTKTEENLEVKPVVRAKTNWDDWLLSGANYSNSGTGVKWKADPLLFSFLNYNTVEGLVFNFGLEYEKTFENNRKLSIKPTVRYGFKNQEPQGILNLAYTFRPERSETIYVEGGRFVEAYSRNNAITPSLNTAYSLIDGKNFLKLYQRTYAGLGYSRDWLKNLNLNISGEYTQREFMENSTDYSWVKSEDLQFTPNFPQTNLEFPDTPLAISNHEAFIFNAKLRYIPGARYATFPNGKKLIGNVLPVFELTYRKGLLDVDFDEINFKMSDFFPWGTFGQTRLQVGGGLFLNDSEMTFIDFHHFLGNRTVSSFNDISHFDLLDYYEFSTQKGYVEAHLQHNFNGFIFRGVPLINKWKWQNLLVANYLYTEAGGHYYELGWGIEGVLGFIRLEYVFAFRENGLQDSGLRIGFSR